LKKWTGFQTNLEKTAKKKNIFLFPEAGQAICDGHTAYFCQWPLFILLGKKTFAKPERIIK
jgi:hypothetical protein